MTAIGDLNGDGVVELLVGAASSHDGGSERGAIHAVFLSPLLCAPGTYVNPDWFSPTACLPCAAGTSQPLEGSPSCVRCGPGTFQSKEGSSSCQRCGRGKSCLHYEATEEKECPLGASCANSQYPELAILPHSLPFYDPLAVAIVESQIQDETWSYKVYLTGPPGGTSGALRLSVRQYFDDFGATDCTNNHNRVKLVTTELVFDDNNYSEPQVVEVHVPENKLFQGPVRSFFTHTVHGDISDEWKLQDLTSLSLTIIDDSSCPSFSLPLSYLENQRIRTCQCTTNYYVTEVDRDHCRR
jgi:hypothetical protein